MTATPTLSIIDNADDSGATAAISGSDSGAANEVLAAPWSGGLEAAAWTSAGSRTGDGTIGLSLASGYYWAYVKSTLGGDSATGAPVGIRATDGNDSVFEQCLNAVKAKLQSLTLTGIANTSITIRKLPWNRNAVRPGVYIYPRTETTLAGTNERDDLGYGVMIAVIQASNQDLTANLGGELAWRQQISRAFRNQPLAGVEEIYAVEVEPGEVIHPKAFEKNYDVQSLLLRCLSREVRGV